MSLNKPAQIQDNLEEIKGPEKDEKHDKVKEVYEPEEVQIEVKIDEKGFKDLEITKFNLGDVILSRDFENVQRWMNNQGIVRIRKLNLE